MQHVNESIKYREAMPFINAFGVSDIIFNPAFVDSLGRKTKRVFKKMQKAMQYT